MVTRTITLILMLVAAPGSSVSAGAQVPSTMRDVDRLREHLSAQGFEAEVCRYDVNGDGADDLLALLRTGGQPGAVKPPTPGRVPTGENVTGPEKGVVTAAFSLQTLDQVLTLRRDMPTGQAEHVYLRVFDHVYEVPISSIAGCHGSLQDYTYRTCLMKGFFTREKTQAFPTLPGCPAEEAEHHDSPPPQEGRGLCD